MAASRRERRPEDEAEIESRLADDPWQRSEQLLTTNVEYGRFSPALSGSKEA
jgi:hypothetical protein